LHPTKIGKLRRAESALRETIFQLSTILGTFPERGLLVYHLPPYSPELNSIERLWKKLKYQLMPVDAWEKFSTLLGTLTSKLCEIGEVSYMPSLRSYAH